MEEMKKKASMIHEDCFAFKRRSNGSKTCFVLTEMICKKRNCPFYKTVEQYEEGFMDEMYDYEMIKVKRRK